MKKSIYLAVVICIAAFSGCSNQPGPVSLIAPGAVVEQAADGFTFTEGPAADAEGNLYFTDVAAQKIYKLAVDGTLSVFMEHSFGTNGLYFDAAGNLIGCVGNLGKIAVINMDATMTDIAGEYDNIPFNSPNDLWIDPKGGIYFTDPRYGDRSNLPQAGEHVYYIAPDRKTVIRVLDKMVRPNGLIGTPDGTILYVADHGAEMTYKYSINDDGTLTHSRIFVQEGSDGVTMDELGNLYITTDAVKVYNPKGELIDTIQTPQQPSNITFAGPHKNILYITARNGLYKIKMNVKGI